MSWWIHKFVSDEQKFIEHFPNAVPSKNYHRMMKSLINFLFGTIKKEGSTSD